MYNVVVILACSEKEITEVLRRFTEHRNETERIERQPPNEAVFRGGAGFGDKRPPAIVEEMIRYVNRHLSDESLTLQKLSKEVFFMNSDYLGKLFKRQTGERFSYYVTKVRIHQAARLIRECEHMKLNEIAVKVGYGNNPHYFTRAFKKIVGYSPSEYKSGCRAKARDASDML